MAHRHECAAEADGAALPSQGRLRRPPSSHPCAPQPDRAETLSWTAFSISLLIVGPACRCDPTLGHLGSARSHEALRQTAPRWSWPRVRQAARLPRLPPSAPHVVAQFRDPTRPCLHVLVGTWYPNGLTYKQRSLPLSRHDYCYATDAHTNRTSKLRPRGFHECSYQLFTHSSRAPCQGQAFRLHGWLFALTHRDRELLLLLLL